MNKYDIELKRQREFKKQFLAGKTAEEIEIIEPIKKKFLQSREGITKEKYNQLIKYFLNDDFSKYLKHDIYKCHEYLHLDPEEIQLYRVVLKGCFIL